MARYGNLEKKYLSEVIDSGNLFYANGKFTKNLTDRVKKFFNIDYAALMSSGTAALHCALGALQIPPGFEVITSPITDMGTLIGILYQNLIPIFADVDPHTYNITAESIKKVITERTRAIIIVHLAANPAEMNSIMELAEEYKLYVIEDCAQSYGAKIGQKYVGTFGHIGCYSLNAYKHISCGDGGFLITDNKGFYQKAFNFADKNYDRLQLNDRLNSLAPNYRITELQSAVALAQFQQLDEITKLRHEFGDAFNQGIKDISGVFPHKVNEMNYCTYWFTMIRIDPKQIGVSREEIVAALNYEKVEATAGYIPRPIYMEPLFLNKSFFPENIWPAELAADKQYTYAQGLCPIAEEILTTAIRIPIDETMSEKKIQQMIKGVHTAIENVREE
jgi:dTDP-4-amino-4,6-dideoxygalactose transaminase